MLEHAMAIDAIVGLQRGDEGKGRFVDMLMDAYDIGARFNGGPNAGHTVVSPEGKTLKLNTVPSGIAYPDKKNVIGDGVFVDALKLDNEIDYLRNQDIAVSPDNLLISSSAHLILPHHILMDALREQGDDRQGSTKSGIAQVDSDFGLRSGIRAEIINNDPGKLYDAVYEGLRTVGSPANESDKETAKTYVERAEKLGDYITDTMLFLNNALAGGQDILAEGAQAFLLDKYQGMWPYTTSSITTAGGISPGLGVPPQSIRTVLGVAKAVHSHVGDGHFVTEIHDDDPRLLASLHGDLRAADAERGTVTGRTRRLGHLDIPQLRRANMANGTTEMAITKLDWLSRYVEVIPICVGYKRKGKILPVAPNAEYKLQQSTPVYDELPAWQEDVSEVRRYQDLPENAQNYIAFIQDRTGVLITRIGVGPRRDQVIVRS